MIRYANQASSIIVYPKPTTKKFRDVFAVERLADYFPFV